MKNFVSPHVHIQSLDSASTPEAFVARELELGSGALTVTDHGTLVACRKVYDLGKKAGLTPILGLEAYVRDDNCPILTAKGVPKNDANTFADWVKYTHITMHAQDQAAYECMVRRLSKADLRAERHGSERKPLFGWEDLEEIGSHNTTMTSGCLIGIVARHLLDQNDLGVARQYYEKVRSLVKPGNFFIEVFAHDCSKNWVQGVFLTTEDDAGKQTTVKYHAKKWVKTNSGDEITVADLARAFSLKNNSHHSLVAVKNYTKWDDLPQHKLVKVEHVEGFLDNECRPWCPDGDLQAGVNKVMIALAKQYGDPILCSDDSHYATPDEQIIQEVRLAQSGSWKFYGKYNRQSSDEAYSFLSHKLGVTEKEFEGWVDNSHAWAAKFKDFKFESKPSLPTKFYEELYPKYDWFRNERIAPGNHSLMYIRELIKLHGRMDWKNQVYVERLAIEIKLFHNNGKIDLLPYFMLAEEVCEVYAKQGILAGPGRGSSAGVLLAYLLGITHVDPIRYGLSLDRFLTLDRIESGALPDIDLDFPDRELLTTPETGFLHTRFGDHFAQICTVNTLRLKMAVKDVARFRYGHVPPLVEQLTKEFELPPQGINSDQEFALGYETDEGHVQGSIERDPALQKYVQAYPEDWKLVQKALGLGRSIGRHASAFVVADRPIQEFIPTTTISDVRCTAYTAESVEAVGGIKMDFLNVSMYGVLSEAIKLVQKRSGVKIPTSTDINGRKVPGYMLLPFQGQLHDIYNLPEDQDVFADVCEGRTETMFQFGTPGAQKWLRHFKNKTKALKWAIGSVEDMATFTALDRKGPLDVLVVDPTDPTGEKKHNTLVEYARRIRGEEPSPGILPFFNQLLPETQGVLVFQEQLQYVYQKLTGCTGPKAEEFRRDVAKKKFDKIEKVFGAFIEGASRTMTEEQARETWQFFKAWSGYGFCKAHAVSYCLTSYATAFLKHHYPLEWWTAVLRGATKNEIAEKFWKHAGKMIDLPDVKYSGEGFQIQNERIRAPLSLLHGVGDTAHDQLMRYAPYTDIKDFCQKIEVHREATKYPTKKVVTEDKKTKYVKCDESEVTHWKKGHNALNRKIVYTMIISGAMDTLLPATVTLPDGTEVEATTTDKLQAFEAALAEATNAKRPKKVDEKYLDIGPVARYQMRKVILPIYGEDLVPILLESQSPLVSMRQQSVYVETATEVKAEATDLPYFRYTRNNGDSAWIRIATAQDLEALDQIEHIEKGDPIQVAVLAYVDEAKPFAFVKEDGKREACKLMLDIEGAKAEYVKWSNKKLRKIPLIFNEALTGCIVGVIMSKYDASRPFAIDDLVVIAPALDHGADEVDGGE